MSEPRQKRRAAAGKPLNIRMGAELEARLERVLAAYHHEIERSELVRLAVDAFLSLCETHRGVILPPGLAAADDAYRAEVLTALARLARAAEQRARDARLEPLVPVALAKMRGAAD